MTSPPGPFCLCLGRRIPSSAGAPAAEEEELSSQECCRKRGNDSMNLVLPSFLWSSQLSLLSSLHLLSLFLVLYSRFPPRPPTSEWPPPPPPPPPPAKQSVSSFRQFQTPSYRCSSWNFAMTQTLISDYIRYLSDSTIKKTSANDEF